MQVRIEIKGGVAYLVDKPRGVEVEIVDYDDAAVAGPTLHTDFYPREVVISNEKEQPCPSKS